MLSVTIVQPTNHDGHDLAAGAVVELPEAAARALMACGSAQPAQPGTGDAQGAVAAAAAPPPAVRRKSAKG